MQTELIFLIKTQVDFGISNRALTHKQMYYFRAPFLRTNASFEIIARERQPIHWPCCVVPWTSAADWSKNKSLGPLDMEGEEEARSWVSPLKHCSAAEILAIVLGTHSSKREWNISPRSVSQLILRVFIFYLFFSISEFSELRTDFCFWPLPFLMRSWQRLEMEANSRTRFPFSPAHLCQWFTPGTRGPDMTPKRNFTSTQGQPIHFFPKPKTRPAHSLASS